MHQTGSMMNEESSRKSSRRSCKSTTEEINTNTAKRRQWNARNLVCHWNLTCKALSIGLFLMVIGGSMATIGYFLDHISTNANNRGNDTDIYREKNKTRLNFQSFATYVGPMIMGVGAKVTPATEAPQGVEATPVSSPPPSVASSTPASAYVNAREDGSSDTTNERRDIGGAQLDVTGFIVVAACVMTFEQRDNAAKVMPNRQQLSTATTHSHSINRHKPSPGGRQPLREGSGRRTTQAGHPLDGADDFVRRDLTADFIHFSRHLQQANIEKSVGRQPMGRCPSAPDLAASELAGRAPLSPRHHAKLSRNSLHPLIGQPFLSPHPLHRQALSVDNGDYYPPCSASPPRSKRSSRQGSTSTARGSAESLEAEQRHHRASHASMMLDLHVPNDWPVSMRIRERNPRRSDTARRHLLTRQAPIDGEEDAGEQRDLRTGSPQLGAAPCGRRQSYSSRICSVDEPAAHRCRPLNEIPLRSSSPSLQHKQRPAYWRSNTVCNEPSASSSSASYRRSSNTSESGALRKGSADYHYHRNRRKSSNTSDSSRYCSRTNVDEAQRHHRNRSPTSSLRSFQELRYLSQRLNEAELRHESRGQPDKRQQPFKCRRQSPKGRGSRAAANQSLSPDSASVSSSTTDGHCKCDFASVEVEPPEDEKRADCDK